jgi:hypothetical protein
MRVLVAKSDFGGHTRGSKITDQKEIEAVLAGENAHHVIQSDHDEAEIVPAPVEIAHDDTEE